jgi:alanine racemase
MPHCDGPVPAGSARAWLEVDTQKFASNVNTLVGHIAPLRCMAVLKADGYGLGAESLAAALLDTQVAGFGVATLGEAVALKGLGRPIFILESVTQEEIPHLVTEPFIVPISDAVVAELLSREAAERGRVVPCQINIDTGMGRLGIWHTEALDAVQRIASLPGIKLVGAMSHFPHANQDEPFSNGQVAIFKDLVARCAERGIEFEHLHIANSDGVHNIPEALEPPFTMVRTGINIYGAYEPELKQAFGFEQVVRLKSRLAAVRRLPASTGIGYNRTFRLKTDSRVGTVPLGYADGVPFGMANAGHVIVRGKQCPVIGRVSMDHITVLLDNVPEALYGDEVTLLGDGLTERQWAAHRGSITYDVLCALGNRIERRYV